MFITSHWQNTICKAAAAIIPTIRIGALAIGSATALCPSDTLRERAIAEFQKPDTPPAVFILSLKAGGVGITLTKANHVFHFERW